MLPNLQSIKIIYLSASLTLILLAVIHFSSYYTHIMVKNIRPIWLKENESSFAVALTLLEISFLQLEYFHFGLISLVIHQSITVFCQESSSFLVKCKEKC